MYIKSISDIHLEHGRPFNIPPAPQDSQTILIMPGDLTKGSVFVDYIETVIKETENRYHSYIFIPGNHEFYGNDFNEMVNHFNEAKETIRQKYSNVYMSTSFDQVEIQGTVYMFGTMWTDGGKTLKDRILLGPFMNDFRVIKDKFHVSKNFTTERMYREFLKFIDNLGCALTEVPEYKKVVLITHHMPDYQCIDPMFKDSNINGGFAVDLNDYIPSSLLSKISVMVFGHTHCPVVKRITLAKSQHEVQVICNPRGYPMVHRSTGEKYFESRGFDPELLFDLDAMAFE